MKKTKRGDATKTYASANGEESNNERMKSAQASKMNDAPNECSDNYVQRFTLRLLTECELSVTVYLCLKKQKFFEMYTVTQSRTIFC